MHNDISYTLPQGVIPVLTTPAGQCLTAANWQDAQTQVVSCHLSQLLIKPGLALLDQLVDLKIYIGWPYALVLNASLPKANKSDIYTLRSEYDGSYVRHTKEDIVALINKLKPEYVIFPENVADVNVLTELPDTIFPFIPVVDCPVVSTQRIYGVYIYFDKSAQSIDDLLAQVEAHQTFPLYVAGDLDLDLLVSLRQKGVQWVESNIPALEAYSGNAYTAEGLQSMVAPQSSMDFSVIDASCQCPTCQQKFTQAYLHHLFHHTPLLCQRLLIMHNIFYTNKIARG